MMFTHIAFGHRSRFQNLKTDKIFTLKRTPVICCRMGAEYRFKLKLFEGSIYAGYAAVSGYPYHSSKTRRSKYHLYNLALENNYQRLSLGSLLLYIINTEARLNGGGYFYIEYPLYTALGFYLKLGFFPDPEGVSESEKKYQLSASAGADVSSIRNHYLNSKLSLSRRYLFWRCHTEALNTKLCEAMCKKFKYLKPDR